MAILKQLGTWLSGLAQGLDNLPVVSMHEITDESGVTALIEASKSEPQFLFKHSTACPTSSRAYSAVAAYVGEKEEGNPPVHLLKVIESRPASNAAAKLLGVEHRSPQLILLKDGEAIWSASHYGIHTERIEETVKEFCRPGTAATS